MGDVREKYIGWQTVLLKNKELLRKDFSKIGDYGCLFLCLCSIAEEWNEARHNQRRVDVLDLYIKSRNKGFLKDDFLCEDQCAILALATGQEWKKEVFGSLPGSVPWNSYTVEKWHNKRTDFTHFRRRWGDTLASSVTVREGVLQEYYIYSVVL